MLPRPGSARARLLRAHGLTSLKPSREPGQALYDGLARPEAAAWIAKMAQDEVYLIDCLLVAKLDYKIAPISTFNVGTRVSSSLRSDSPWLTKPRPTLPISVFPAGLSEGRSACLRTRSIVCVLHEVMGWLQPEKMPGMHGGSYKVSHLLKEPGVQLVTGSERDEGLGLGCDDHS